MSRSPENTFVSGDSHKRISSTKLLFNESNHRNSGDNSMDNFTNELILSDPFTTCNSGRLSDDYPCRFNSTELTVSGIPKRQEDKSIDVDIAIINEHNSIFNQIDAQSGISQNQCQHVPKHCRVGKYLIAVHRKITRQDSYFLSYHKTRPSLFGVPMLIPHAEGDTYQKLYCAVWMQVSRLLSPLPASTDQANHAADCDDSLGYDFPFTLRAVKSDGLTCALCPWTNFCRGCEIPCNNDYVLSGSLLFGITNTSNASTPKLTTKFSSLPNLEMRHPTYNASLSLTNNVSPSSSKHLQDFTIAIDWDPTALHLRYQSTLERLWTDHETVGICRKEQVEPVDLNHCLRAFTSEEKLEQWYYCSHCKGKKPATKKLQIWKLPPILIVHLKRFNCVNGKWVKSQKVVHFPFDDFDPTPYLASVPQETILRHKELLDMQEIVESKEEEPEANQHENKLQYNTNGNNDIDHTNLMQVVVDNDININNRTNMQCKTTTKMDDCHNVVICENSNRTIRNIVPVRGMVVQRVELNNLDNTTMLSNTLRGESSKVEKRKRLISTSLTKTPIVDGEFEDYHQHKLKFGEDKFDPNYKLYAVVSHSGMLNGGHYISYAANQTGSWYCFNDSSCREISSKPNIDPSSAYLLFYERRGLDYEPYLPNIDGKTLPNGSLDIDIDESDNDLKKLCVIS